MIRSRCAIAVEPRRVLRDERRRRRLERQDLELVLGPFRERRAVATRALAFRRRPLLAGPEVVDVAEEDVVHRLPVGDGDREREERDAALRVQRAVDRVDDDRVAARPFDADLFADDGHVFAAEALEDHALGGRVDRGRLVAALARADDRLALSPTGQLGEHRLHVGARRAAEREPVHGVIQCGAFIRERAAGPR